jgi:hypothetical protein
MKSLREGLINTPEKSRYILNALRIKVEFLFSKIIKIIKKLN